MKPSLLVVKSRVRIDPTFENHVGYMDFNFANREYKKFEQIYFKCFGSETPSGMSTKELLYQFFSQSHTKLTNTIQINLFEYNGLDVGGFIENLNEVFNVVEG